MEPEAGAEKSIKVPDSVIRAALLRRAVEDIHRIIQIRTAKAACSSLLARGSVGDDLWQRFERAEKEMEEELRDVVMEVRPPAFPLSVPPPQNNTSAGQRPRAQLGPNHLPVRQRDRRQHHPPRAPARDPGHGRPGEAVVGEAPRACGPGGGGRVGQGGGGSGGGGRGGGAGQVGERDERAQRGERGRAGAGGDARDARGDAGSDAVGEEEEGEEIDAGGGWGCLVPCTVP